MIITMSWYVSLKATSIILLLSWIIGSVLQMHYVRFSQFYWQFWANIVMHKCSILQVCIIAIWSQGLILNLESHTQLLAPRYPFIELIQGAFWVQNGKNDAFTKMSAES